MLVLCCRKTAGHPPLPGTGPEPAVPAWAHDTDGAGPALLSPDGAPARRLLMDGYVNDIRDDQDHPPWQEGRRASMDGVRRPDERDASPLAAIEREPRYKGQG